jgi:hypothetical protein
VAEAAYEGAKAHAKRRREEADQANTTLRDLIRDLAKRRHDARYEPKDTDDHTQPARETGSPVGGDMGAAGAASLSPDGGDSAAVSNVPADGASADNAPLSGENDEALFTSDEPPTDAPLTYEELAEDASNARDPRTPASRRRRPDHARSRRCLDGSTVHRGRAHGHSNRLRPTRTTPTASRPRSSGPHTSPWRSMGRRRTRRRNARRSRPRGDARDEADQVHDAQAPLQRLRREVRARDGEVPTLPATTDRRPAAIETEIPGRSR